MYPDSCNFRSDWIVDRYTGRQFRIFYEHRCSHLANAAYRDFVYHCQWPIPYRFVATRFGSVYANIFRQNCNFLPHPEFCEYSSYLWFDFKMVTFLICLDKKVSIRAQIQSRKSLNELGISLIFIWEINISNFKSSNKFIREFLLGRYSTYSIWNCLLNTHLDY